MTRYQDSIDKIWKSAVNVFVFTCHLFVMICLITPIMLIVIILWFGLILVITKFLSIIICVPIIVMN